MIGWTETLDAQLRDLVEDRGLSFEQAAQIMGHNISRNAAIGRARRIGINSPNPSGGSRSRETWNKGKRLDGPSRGRVTNPIGRRPRTKPIFYPKPRSIPDYDAKRPLISLLDLTGKTCRWPVGDPGTKSFGFCGHDKHEGEIYCHHHCRIAYPNKDRATAV